MTFNPYKKATPSIGYYGSAVTGGSEPNMREEAINTLEGSLPEIAKGQPGVLRRMRRDSSNALIPCDCVDPVTFEPDKDRFCPICFGEGYLWDEEHFNFYRVMKDSDTGNAMKHKLHEPGLINAPLVVFYTRYDEDITVDDKVVRLELELDGTTSTPLKRKKIYKIEGVWDYRADNGKLEYWKLFTHEDKVKYLNAPTFGDL